MPAIAAVAAVLLAILAAAVLVYIRGGSHAPVTPGGPPSPVASSAPSPSASPRVLLPAQVVLSAPSHDVVWALVFGQEPYLFRSTDHGQTWEQRPLPQFAGQGVEISFVDDHEGWLSALSSPETQCNAQGIDIWHTSDAGATWHQLDVKGIADAQCKSGLSFTDKLHGFIGAWSQLSRPVVYFTSDGGRTWTASAPFSDPPGFAFEPAAATLSAGTVRAFGKILVVPVHGQSSGSQVLDVYMSTDGGATWGFNAEAPNSGGSIGFASAQHWVQLIVPGQSMETTDGGATWHTSASDYDQAAPIAPQVVFADDEVGYATVRGGIQLTTDGGLHWSEIQTPGT